VPPRYSRQGIDRTSPAPSEFANGVKCWDWANVELPVALTTVLRPALLLMTAGALAAIRQPIVAGIFSVAIVVSSFAGRDLEAIAQRARRRVVFPLTLRYIHPDG
jgi:hypothetical protein